MFIFKGETALMAAARGGNLDIVKLFLNKGADVKAKDDGGKLFIQLCRANLFLTYYENILKSNQYQPKTKIKLLCKAQ